MIIGSIREKHAMTNIEVVASVRVKVGKHDISTAQRLPGLEAGDCVTIAQFTKQVIKTQMLKKIKKNNDNLRRHITC